MYEYWQAAAAKNAIPTQEKVWHKRTQISEKHDAVKSKHRLMLF